MENHNMNHFGKMHEQMNFENSMKQMNHTEHEENNGEHEGHSSEMFKKRFLIVLFLSIPLLLLSPTIQGWLNFSFLFSGDTLVLFVLASIVVLWGGLPFFTGAVREIKRKDFGMMVLVSIAVLAGYIYSAGTTFIFTAPDFYWEISTLTLFLLFGHYMEMRSVEGASGALGELVKLIPKKANLVKGKDIIEVSTDELKVGDIVLVKPGEKIPVDGIVIEGETSINESMITGESKPILKKKGDKVIGGSINFDGSIKFEVSKTGKDTTIHQIINLVKEAQSSKPKTQRLADRAANYLTLAAITIGTLSFFYWAFFSSQDFVFALTIAITVFVIACPHALGLAIPVVTSISTTLAAKNGILIRDMTAVEIAEKLDYVVFDKTGTLTKGVFEVTEIAGDVQTLEYAVSIEQNSEHIIGKGIINKAKVFGVIALSDIVREESKEAIKLLKEMNIKTVMITGDNKQTAEQVAKELGIDIYFAEVLPKDKVNKIKELQEKGKVAMVGDGINDAPALTQADIGIAIGAGTDVAVQSAEVVLVKNNPLEVAKLIRLSKVTRKKMKQNLWWAAGYNFLAIPIAAGVLIPIGIKLRPEFGALIMATSSIIVVINSLMLKKFK